MTYNHVALQVNSTVYTKQIYMSDHFVCFISLSQALEDLLKHTTTLFSLSDHYILSREWRVIVDQVQTNYQGMPMVL